MTSNKEVHRMIEKRRNAIVNKMNAFIKEENPKHGNEGEYVLWMSAYCQIIAYLIDNVFNHDEQKLKDMITLLSAYYLESKKKKEEENGK